MDKEFEQRKRKLPQWRMRDAVYYVTWSLRENRSEMQPQHRSIVQECLLHFHGKRYRLYAYVVMNDHVHAIVQPLKGYELSKILHTWKSYTAHEINKLTGQTGPLWLDESYNHIIRNEPELYQKAEYVVTNPVRRWPGVKDYEWCGWFEF
jgi:REP element-mobilizing transposase RayT